MTDDLQDGFDAALQAGDPRKALREEVLRLFEAGYSKQLLLEALETYRIRLQMEEREEDEDTVLEVLDFLTGWSSPHTRIPPES